MNPNQFREHIVKPVLRYLDPVIPYSDTAVELLMMTAAHESLMGYYLKQKKGPALGPYQMEPATEIDIWENYLEYEEDLAELVNRIAAPDILESADLVGNLFYATAMARVHYYRDPQALPSGDLHYESTIRELSHYAKRVFNTEAGAAHADDYFHAYMRRASGSL